MLSSKTKRELKIDQRQILIDSIEIGIPSPQQILRWGERSLPNGKKVGLIKNSKTVNYKRFTPFRDGLFCERIFGPVTSFVCACGKKQPHSKVSFCEKCEVEYIDQRSRRYRLGYISLLSPVTHIWYLKGRPSYLSLFLGKRKKTVVALAYCNAYLVEHGISEKSNNVKTLDIRPKNKVVSFKKNDFAKQRTRTKICKSNRFTENFCTNLAPFTCPCPYKAELCKGKGGTNLQFVKSFVRDRFTQSTCLLPMPYGQGHGQLQERRFVRARANKALYKYKAELCKEICTTHALRARARARTCKGTSLVRVTEGLRTQVLPVTSSSCKHKYKVAGKALRSFARSCASSFYRRRLSRRGTGETGVCMDNVANVRALINLVVPYKAPLVPMPSQHKQSFVRHEQKQVKENIRSAKKCGGKTGPFAIKTRLGFKEKSERDLGVSSKAFSYGTCFYARQHTLPFLPSFVSHFYLRDALLNFVFSSAAHEDLPLMEYCLMKRREPLRDVHKFMAQRTVDNLFKEGDRKTDFSYSREGKSKNPVTFTCPCPKGMGGINLRFVKSFVRDKFFKQRSVCPYKSVYEYKASLCKKLCFCKGGGYKATLCNAMQHKFLNKKFQTQGLNLVRSKFGLHTMCTQLNLREPRMYKSKICWPYKASYKAKLCTCKKLGTYKPLQSEDLVPVGHGQGHELCNGYKALYPTGVSGALHGTRFGSQASVSEGLPLRRQLSNARISFLPEMAESKKKGRHSVDGFTKEAHRFKGLRGYKSSSCLQDHALQASLYKQKPYMPYKAELLPMPYGHGHGYKQSFVGEKRGKLNLSTKQTSQLCFSEDLFSKTYLPNFVRGALQKRKKRSRCFPTAFSAERSVVGAEFIFSDTEQRTDLSEEANSPLLSGLELTAIREILSYTGGGALQQLLQQFNQHDLCKFLVAESQILRVVYETKIANGLDSNSVPFRHKVSEGGAFRTPFDKEDLYKDKSSICKSFFASKAELMRTKRSFVCRTSTRFVPPLQIQSPLQSGALYMTDSLNEDLMSYKAKLCKGHGQVMPVGTKEACVRTSKSLDSEKTRTKKSLYEDFQSKINDLQRKQMLRLSRRIYKIARRLKITQLLSRNHRQPEWMILSHLPVLPPDLRPILQMSEKVVVASDLNIMYQRVVYRNNRHLRVRFIDFHLVTAIQRLVQDAVDKLIENGKGGSKPYYTQGGRPLKSLSDILKGKKGRFRLNLLGKRVDFSGRSVIVVSPLCQIHECGLPKEIALELYHYFLLRQLIVKKHCASIVTAKKMIKSKSSLMWGVLKELMYHHPVLLNRAPTLHRLGIQAFQPKLVLGNAILLHPLVCSGFNADFDGDQMGVHLPLSFAARAESWDLLWSRNNLLSPATGQPMLVPSQDMVLGFYYMTAEASRNKKSRWLKGDLFKNKPSANVTPVLASKTKSQSTLQSRALDVTDSAFVSSNQNRFLNPKDVTTSLQTGKIKLHQPVWLYWSGKIENNEPFQNPLELRVRSFGAQQSVYENHISSNLFTKNQARDKNQLLSYKQELPFYNRWKGGPVVVASFACRTKLRMGVQSAQRTNTSSFFISSKADAHYVRTTAGRVLMNNLIKD